MKMNSEVSPKDLLTDTAKAVLVKLGVLEAIGPKANPTLQCNLHSDKENL